MIYPNSSARISTRYKNQENDFAFKFATSSTN